MTPPTIAPTLLLELGSSDALEPADMFVFVG